MKNDSSFSVASLLLRTVERHPGELALAVGERRYSYAQLGERVTRLANAWFDAGVRCGDRIVIFAHTGELSVLTYFASQLLGAVAVPINFRLAPGEVEYIVRDAGARVLAFGSRLAPVVDRLGPELRARLLLTSDADVAGATSVESLIAGAASSALRWALPAPDDLAALVYTSGTTGRPKGVMHTHANDVAIAFNCVMEYGLNPADRALHIAPLYHVGGMQAWFLPHLTVGAANLLHEQYEAQATLAAIESEHVTTLFAVPTQIVEMLHHPRFAGFNLRSLRLITTGGAAIAEATMERVVRDLCPQVFNGYGMTEASLTLLLHPRHALERLGSCGKPTLISRCRLIAIDGDESTESAPGEVGQLIVQGPQVMSGYWNLPEESARRLRNGWLYTGDLFERDGDGFFHFRGRADDMIVSGGENIYPREVEEVLHRCDGVKEAAVVGLPDPKWGSVVTAFVVRSDAALSVEAIDSFFKDSGLIAAFKRPRRVIFVDALPINPSGKVLKRELVARHSTQELAA